MEKIEISFATPLRVVLSEEEQPYRAIFTVQFEQTTIKGENMSSTMQIETYATVSVEWKDSGGRTVRVDGPTQWASSDTSICQCTVSSGNPQIANLFAPGPKIGTVQIHATADADLGSGVKTVTATYTVEVITGEAVGGDITFTQSPAQGANKSPAQGAKPTLPRR